MSLIQDKNRWMEEQGRDMESGLSQVPAPCDCSAWEVDYDMFLRDDYTKKEKIAKRLNEGWTEMGMLPWVVEGKDAGFHVWWKRQNASLEARAETTNNGGSDNE